MAGEEGVKFPGPFLWKLSHFLIRKNFLCPALRHSSPNEQSTPPILVPLWLRIYRLLYFNLKLSSHYSSPLICLFQLAG